MFSAAPDVILTNGWFNNVTVIRGFNKDELAWGVDTFGMGSYWACDNVTIQHYGMDDIGIGSYRPVTMLQYNTMEWTMSIWGLTGPVIMLQFNTMDWNMLPNNIILWNGRY